MFPNVTVLVVTKNLNKELPFGTNRISDFTLDVSTTNIQHLAKLYLKTSVLHQCIDILKPSQMEQFTYKFTQCFKLVLLF